MAKLFKKEIIKLRKIYSLIVNYLLGGNKIRKIAIEEVTSKGDNVLDLACGFGINFYYIINEIGKNGKLVGVDNSEEMINLAQKLIEKNNWHNISLEKNNVSNLKYKEKFDVVICTFGLSVFQEWKKAIDVIINSVKKSGKICIVDEVYTKKFPWIFNLFVWLDSKLNMADPKREILEELKKNLKILKIKKFLFGTILVMICEKRELDSFRFQLKKDL